MPVNENVQRSARLAEMYQELVYLQELANHVVESPDVCAHNKTIFIIWYEMTISKISKELDEITEQVL